ASLVNTHIAEIVVNKHNPHSVYTSHGVYVDYAPIVFISEKKGIKTIVWDSGFSDFLHYFTVAKSSKEYRMRSLSEKAWNIRKQKKLSIEQNEKLNDYFHKRYFEAKARDLNINSKPEEKELLKRKIGIKNNLPIICLYAHISWDAVFGTGVMIFESANAWVIESIKKMITNKNVNWIIKVHPSEVADGSLYTASDIISKEFPVLPEHIKVLHHDSDINTYGTYKMIDAGITIYGTVGIELPTFGKPIIVAGNANFGNKGFSIDAKSKEEYFSILENAENIKPLTPEQIELAKKYAYSFFIQSQIPINIINKSEGHWGNIDIDRLDAILPEKDTVMDKICNGIINGKDVILD
ncbi:MAG: hypothetical protein PHD97_12720, partial [Bacteroidales bacterium]|nr:hypothetical protein [Bacteroidales bacterium]